MRGTLELAFTSVTLWVARCRPASAAHSACHNMGLLLLLAFLYETVDVLHAAIRTCVRRAILCVPLRVSDQEELLFFSKVACMRMQQV